MVPEPPNEILVPLTVNELLASLACANVPVEMLLAFSEVNPLPLPVKIPVLAVKLTAVAVPFTSKVVNVPTDVMLGCAFVVTVPAVVAIVALDANVALATVPVTLAP